MIVVVPVVGVEKCDRVVFLRYRHQRGRASREIAEVGVGAVELDMADACVVQPALRKSIGHKDMVARARWRRTLPRQRSRRARSSL